MDDSPINVLYLDDSLAALEAVESALDPALYAVRTVNSVGEARPWVSSADIVIVDFHMPGINGAEALSMLRAEVDGEAPAFYLYTTDTTVAVDFRTYGFDGAFTDKGNPQTLVGKLATAARLIRMRRLRAKLA